jgi:hypothetical protein
MSQQDQLNLITPEEIWRDSLLAKINGLIDYRVSENLAKCGREEIYKTCKACGDWQTFYYRCSMKFCPLCNWRIARGRAELLRKWVEHIDQPKHVVVTMRNFQLLTRRQIRKFQKAFCKLRHRKILRHASGGCVSFEITNEGRGWHLHAHCLINVSWIDAGELARVWGNLVGQEFGIVKVKDARGATYLQEVTKYVVKGSQLVSWEPEEISQFIHAIKGIRFFATFGTLFKMRRRIAAELLGEKPPPTPCKCGCSDFTYTSEATEICRDVENS